MAKSDLLNFLKDINFMYNDCGMHDCVSKMLEDFEAEIRAKAIDEFAEKLKAVCDSMILEERNHHARPISWAIAYEDFKDDINDIVVQLKE